MVEGTPGPLVFVDLSNVAKDPLLGQAHEHAALLRWERIKSVWLRDRGSPQRFVLVADASLRRALSRADQVTLDRWVTTGQAVSVADADTEVLRLAIADSGVALSNDRFVDHRKLRGLERASLVGWVVRGQHIRLQNRQLDRLLSALISARAYKQDLKALGLTEDSPELEYRWTCRERGCSEDLVALPMMKGGSATCPACGAYLMRGAPWDRPVWIKVLDGETEVERFVVEHGQTVVLGRGVADDMVPLAVVDPGDGALKDRLLKLVNDEARIQVIDLGAPDGTALRLPAPGGRNLHAPPLRLKPNVPMPLKKGAKVILGGSGLVLQISGGGIG